MAKGSTIETPDQIGLTVVNEFDFYSKFARPFLERQALVLTVATPEIAALLPAEFNLLAEYALDFYRWRVVDKHEDLQRPRETPELLSALADYLRSHYHPEEYDPQTRPYGGDLCKSVPAWEWGAFGIREASPYGVIGGDASAHSDSAGILWNAGAFLGKSSKYSTSGLFCSCSGGPGTASTSLIGAKFSGVVVNREYWRWRETPCKDGGVYYREVRPVWLIDCNYRAGA